VKPAAFDLVRAEHVDEILDVLAEVGDEARVIAGGQSLGPMLNLRLAQPEVLIDISRAPGLGQIEWAGSETMLAANVTQAALLASDNLDVKQPLLAEAMPWIGHVQTRARGTVCGSLAHADPAAELPLLFSTLGGTALIRSRSRQRGVDAASFYTGMFETALEPDEFLLAVRFNPPPFGAGMAFEEASERHGDFAIVAVAAVVDDGGVTLGLGGVADTPVVFRWDGMEAAMAPEALAHLTDRIEPRSDPRADANYRRRLIRLMGARVIEKAEARRHAV